MAAGVATEVPLSHKTLGEQRAADSAWESVLSTSPCCPRVRAVNESVLSASPCCQRVRAVNESVPSTSPHIALPWLMAPKVDDRLQDCREHLPGSLPLPPDRVVGLVEGDGI